MKIKQIETEINNIIQNYDLKYETTCFNQAIMIDIWMKNYFVCIQITNEYIGCSIYKKNDTVDFSTIPDTSFKNKDEFFKYFKANITSLIDN